MLQINIGRGVSQYHRGIEIPSLLITPPIMLIQTDCSKQIAVNHGQSRALGTREQGSKEEQYWVSFVNPQFFVWLKLPVRVYIGKFSHLFTMYRL